MFHVVHQFYNTYKIIRFIGTVLVQLVQNKQLLSANEYPKIFLNHVADYSSKTKPQITPNSLMRA